VEVTMLDDSNVDTERLWMTKMRMTRMMTDRYIQTQLLNNVTEGRQSGIIGDVAR